MNLFGETEEATAPPKDGAPAHVVRDLLALGVPRDTIRTYSAAQARAVLSSMRRKQARATVAETEPEYKPPARTYVRPAPEVDAGLDDLRTARASADRLTPHALWTAAMLLDAADLPDLADWIEGRLNATRGRIAPGVESGGIPSEYDGGDSDVDEVDPGDAEYLRSLNEQAEAVPA